jgi:type I restriction enzyme S subunit
VSGSSAVPEGWQISKLGALVQKIGSGITPKGGREVYLDSGTPLIRSQNVLWGKLSLEDIAFISEEQHSKMRNTRVRPQDVLLNITGASIGRSCVVPSEIKDANVNQHVCIVRTGTKLEPHFLSNYLNSSFGQKQISDLQAGGNRQGLNFEQIRSFAIPVPPLEEQRKIAEILSTWDEAIEQQTRLLELKRERKRGLMQQLLTGKVRFKEFEGLEWKNVRLGELGKCIRGVSYKPESVSSVATDHTVKLYRANNIQAGVLVEDDVLFVPKSICRQQQIVQQDDVVICMSNGSKALVGKAARYPGKQGVHTVGAFCSIFRPSDFIGKLFVHQYFVSDLYREKLSTLLAGSSINNLKPSDIESVNLLFPTSVEEQQKIASILSTADAELETLEAQLSALRTQKRGLMQRLLTGKTRVKVDAAPAERAVLP